MLRDIRHGFRVLLQAKGWTAVVILSLAVGIGANIALFSTINGLMLQHLPGVRDPGSLVRLRWVGENDMVHASSEYGFTGEGRGRHQASATFSYPMFQHFQQANQTLVELFATVPISQTIVVIDGRAEPVGVLLASGNYHGGLGLTPRAGRLMGPQDDRPGAPPVAVISSRFWASRFGSDPGVVGKAVRIGPAAVTIIGVAPSEFRGTQRLNAQLHDLTLPMSLDPILSREAPRDGKLPPRRIDDPLHWYVQVTGRIKAGGTPEQVHANFEGVLQHQARASMQTHLDSLSDADRRRADNQNRTAVPDLIVQPAAQGIYDADTRQVRALATIGAVTALVLLLVCANVANLLLSRAAARKRELAVRMAIGASRGRVVRQLLTESLVLAAIGGTAGALIGIWAQDLLPEPIGASTNPDWRVVAFTVAITCVAGLLFGIAPAFRETRLDPGTAMQDNSRSVAASRSLLGRALIVAQVAISLVLLIGAGLFLRTLDNLRNVDLGFDPANLVFVRIAATAPYEGERWLQFYDEGIERLRRVPGVRSATVSSPTMLSGGAWGTTMYVQGRVYPAGREASQGNGIHRVIAAPNYFDTMGIRLTAGRHFTSGDGAEAPKVAIINEAARRKFFPDEDPIGRRVGDSVDSTDEISIVGVVADVKYEDLREPPPPTMYVPHYQRAGGGIPFTIRTIGDPASVMNAAREAIAQIDPNIPVTTVETQMSQLDRRMTQEKVFAQAFTIFGSMAVFVAGIGLFGLLSYGVARRTREIGIRMAMGAQRTEVLTLVVAESLVLTAIGIVLGLAGALAGGRLIASQLFGLSPMDAATMGGAVALMLIVATLACWLPARRATRVDPMVALRYE